MLRCRVPIAYTCTPGGPPLGPTLSGRHPGAELSGREAAATGQADGGWQDGWGLGRGI